MPRNLRFLYTGLNFVLITISAVPLYSEWDRVSAAGLQHAVLYGAGVGVGLVLLLLVATGRLAYRGEKPPTQA